MKYKVRIKHFINCSTHFNQW